MVLLLVAVLAATPALAQRPGRAIRSVPQLTDSIQRLMARDHIPGLLLVLATRDSVLFAGGLSWLAVLTHSVSLAIKLGLYWFVFAEVIKVLMAASVATRWHQQPSGQR